jgi:D-alanyl-D-alanine carboxypeptidase
LENALFKFIKFRYVIFLLAIGVWLFFSLAWETDRNMVRRWVYPYTSRLAVWSTQCDPRAPRWQQALIRELSTGYDSPANQLVFVKASGQATGCFNGWTGTPVLSERVGAGTRLRLASLSKIITFAGLARAWHDQGGWLERPLISGLSAAEFKDPRVLEIRLHHLIGHSAGFDRMKTPDPMVIRDQKPWCPGGLEELKKISLDFAPGTRNVYSNLGFCLAAEMYRAQFGREFSDSVFQEMRLADYGLNYLDTEDSPVSFNFMNQEFYDAGFVRYFDWHALRTSMGVTGNAAGLSRFIAENRGLIGLSQSMKSEPLSCNEGAAESCYNGFLERRKIDGVTLWNQKGYLYGMSGIFVIDEQGNFMVWLGAGDTGRPGAVYEHVLKVFARHR